MKLNKNITSLLSEAKTKFSDDEHEVKLYFPGCFPCLLSFVTFVSSQTKNRDLRLKDKDEVWLKMFFRLFSKSKHYVLPEKLARLFLLKEVKSSSDSKMIKLLFRHYDVFAKTAAKTRIKQMATAIAFSRQNDAAGSSARTT